MTFGIDIYDRYQDITNPAALAASAYDFAIVKLTDGGGKASVPGGDLVRILKSIGIPVGGYHYAQLSPTPEKQAEIFAAEVRSLGATGLPPALDLEDPHPATFVSQDFAKRFLVRLATLGFPVVMLYANTSMLNAIRAWELDDMVRRVGGRVEIWAASYGNNDGAYTQADANRLATAYPHPVKIHQYSSTVSVPGIPGRVDGNWMFGIPPDGEDGEVELTDKIPFWDGFEITVGQALAETWQLLNNLSGRPTRPGQPADTTPWVLQLIQEITNDPDITVERLEQIVRDNSGDVDEDALAERLLARGLTPGATKDEVKEALREELPNARISFTPVAATPGDTPS